MTILSIDIGTTMLKMGMFRADGSDLAFERQYVRELTVATYNDGLFSDIAPGGWRDAIIEGCRALGDSCADVDVVALSGTTPGLTAMNADGEALYPAILMLDQRSRAQAKRIIDTVGLDTLLAVTGNMPVAGGCSLASILWIRDNHPDLFEKTHMFGHTNTYAARFLTGKFALDPTSASLTALYNTASNNLSWNGDIADTFDLSIERLPELMPADESPGRVLPDIASLLGLNKQPPVVIGGNDAVIAAYSVGAIEPGDTINVNGTCEITLVCLPRCIPSIRYNVRTHVVPGRWLTLYVMNAAGKAYEWFRTVMCADMDAERFYTSFMPRAIDTWLGRESAVSYVPFLLGSRYSQEPLKAEFKGLSHSTTREEMLAAMVKGLAEYQRAHLEDIGESIAIANPIRLAGGAVCPSLIGAKKAWMRDCEYLYEEQSSMRGAAMLGKRYLEHH